MCRTVWAVGMALVLGGRAEAGSLLVAPEGSGPDSRVATLGPAARTCAESCHKDIRERKVIHGPAQSDCGACHVLTGNPSDHHFSFIVPKEELCARCHKLPHENTTHKPVAEGRCTECHDPHGSQHPKSLLAEPKRDLCLRCHTPELTKASFVHGPVAVGACIVCHKPHGSSQPKLLSQDARSLCLSCHAEVVSQGEKGMHMHAALDQGCTRCHDPHASNHKYQLREAAPKLCLQCHQERFDAMTKDAKVVHGAVTAEGGCTVCHAAHGSKQPALQRGTQPGTCLECHNTPMNTGDGGSIVNMSALLAANPDKHGPIREGACTACHSPHASKNFRLLTEEYPPEFYAPFQLGTFKLCFSCHIPDLVLRKSGQGLTQFRDGDTNLHWLHVNREKGRTCRACHEVHASKRPSHIREAVPYGSSGWMLEINYEQTPEGGSCAPGCHIPRMYDRGGLSTPRPAPTDTGGKR